MCKIQCLSIGRRYTIEYVIILISISKSANEIATPTECVAHNAIMRWCFSNDNKDIQSTLI